MYGVLHYLAEENLPIPAGWIHLPQLRSVAALDRNIGNPSMSAETSTTAVAVGVQAALERPDDADDLVRSRFQI